MQDRGWGIGALIDSCPSLLPPSLLPSLPPLSSLPPSSFPLSIHLLPSLPSPSLPYSNQKTLHDSCQSRLGDLQNQLNQYDKLEEGLEVPQRFIDRTTSLQEQYANLLSRGDRQRDEVVQTVNSWEEFVAGVDELTSWVRSEVEPELAELRELENFAMEFSSHQARLEVSNLLGMLGI